MPPPAAYTLNSRLPVTALWRLKMPIDVGRKTEAHVESHVESDEEEWTADL